MYSGNTRILISRKLSVTHTNTRLNLKITITPHFCHQRCLSFAFAGTAGLPQLLYWYSTVLMCCSHSLHYQLWCLSSSSTSSCFCIACQSKFTQSVTLQPWGVLAQRHASFLCSLSVCEEGITVPQVIRLQSWKNNDCEHLSFICEAGQASFIKHIFCGIFKHIAIISNILFNLLVSRTRTI